MQLCLGRHARPKEHQPALPATGAFPPPARSPIATPARSRRPTAPPRARGAPMMPAIGSYRPQQPFGVSVTRTVRESCGHQRSCWRPGQA
eukprot:7053509-Alexandrium_andersonii.AAC.1